ncbi:MAG: metal ABC transporter permease [Fibrobacteria bacterium]|nr:metal ABC transporter permease [Fibrobacteria bacterium]
MSLFLPSLIAVLLAAVAAGVVGVLAVSNRMVSLGGGLAHAAYGGVGLAFLTGWLPLPTTLAFTVGAAFLVAWLSERVPDRAETLLGVVWAMGMAFGVICVDLAPGYAGDLQAILFGSLLAIPRIDLWALAIADLLMIVLAWKYRRGLMGVALDPEFAEVSGFPVRWFRRGLLVALSVSVVLLMRVTGLVLLVALLSIPGALGVRWGRGLGGAMAVAGGFAAVFGVLGLSMSWWLDLSTGACIIAVAGTTYLLATLVPARR